MTTQESNTDTHKTHWSRRSVKGSVAQRTAQLVVNLTTSPQYVPRYVAHNFFGNKSPLNLEIPWFSYAAIDFLSGFLRPQMSVFEYGSGGSTIFFSKRVKQVQSVEDDASWYEFVSKRLKEKGLANVSVKLCPFDFKNPVGFEDSAYCRALPNERFDVIVVDGKEEWVHVRPTCFKLAEKHIKPGGIIIVDDSWRYPTLRKQNRAKKVEIFESVGPGRPGVTSTDVFFTEFIFQRWKSSIS